MAKAIYRLIREIRSNSADPDASKAVKAAVAAGATAEDAKEEEAAVVETVDIEVVLAAAAKVAITAHEAADSHKS